MRKEAREGGGHGEKDDAKAIWKEYEIFMRKGVDNFLMV